jgi:hypothetical protein
MAALDKLGAEIPQMGYRPAKARKSQTQKDKQDFEE